MTRAVRRRPAPQSATSSDKPLVPEYLSKSEFGRRLYRMMLDRGWTQSDLARAAFGVNPKSGLPKGRDGISKYVAGKILPNPTTLKKLAEALGVDAEELLPNTIHDSMIGEPPSFEVKQMSGERGRVWLQVNRACSSKTAARVLDLLNQDDDDHGS